MLRIFEFTFGILQEIMQIPHGHFFSKPYLCTIYDHLPSTHADEILSLNNVRIKNQHFKWRL